MSTLYDWYINPFQNLLVSALVSNVDISNKSLKEDIYTEFANMLESITEDDDIGKFLDFEIVNSGDYYKVKGKNFLTSLWLCGIFPENPKFIQKENEYQFNNKIYRFNKKDKLLTVEEIIN